MKTGIAILDELANRLGIAVKHGRLDIPPSYGHGYCEGYLLNPQLRIMVFNYALNMPFELVNPEIGNSNKRILFKLQHIFQGNRQSRLVEPPSVLIATSTLSSEASVVIHSNLAVVNIEVDAAYLQSMFNLTGQSVVLNKLFENEQPLLFEQLFFPALQKVANELLTEAPAGDFKLLFMRIKTEELLCRLMMELEKRDEQKLYALNSQDVTSIYQIRTRILSELSIPPGIEELSGQANMSPTKLKRLFKQVFGDSIFSYYQHFRMLEAARLLKEENISVSETGYRLGFSNLSHFTRVFEAHIGVKPKQYSKGNTG